MFSKKPFCKYISEETWRLTVYSKRILVHNEISGSVYDYCSMLESTTFYLQHNKKK